MKKEVKIGLNWKIKYSYNNLNIFKKQAKAYMKIDVILEGYLYYYGNAIYFVYERELLFRQLEFLFYSEYIFSSLLNTNKVFYVFVFVCMATTIVRYQFE